MRQVLWSLLPVALGGGCPWTSSWQWEGVFHIHKGGTYLWSAEKKDGAYAAASTKIILRTTSTYDASAIESAEPAALTAWSGTFTDVMPGDTLSPNNAYRLVYDADNWVSLFKIQGAAETNLAIFAEHVPTDFENKFNYLHHEEGAATEPSYEVSSVTSCDPPEEPIVKGTIGEVLAASMLITLPTLLGIGCLFSVCKCSSASEHVKTFIHYCNAGASGVLFAVSIFLLMPEASHLMAAGKSEAGLAVAWGSCVIAGWLLGIMMHQASHMLQPAQVAADNTLEEGQEKEPVAKKANWSLAIPVLLGDFIHNFADGIFLGFAFYACDASFAWSMSPHVGRLLRVGEQGESALVHRDVLELSHGTLQCFGRRGGLLSRSGQ